MSTDPSGVPERLGPYRVDGLWHSDDVGVVLDARGPQGRVELVLLAAAPLRDATARARFQTAASTLQRQGRLIHNGSSEEVPWVAIQAGSGPTGAQPLLAPIWPDVIDDDLKGPTYVPHWRGMPSAYPARPLPLPGNRLPWWWWLVGFLIALLIFFLLASCLTQEQPGDGGGTGTQTQTVSPDPTESGPSSPGQTSPGQSSTGQSSSGQTSPGESSPGESSGGQSSSGQSSSGPEGSSSSGSSSAPEGSPTQPSDTSTNLPDPSGNPPSEDPTARF